MATFTVQELSEYYGTSKRTFERHLKILKEQRGFKKTSIGESYNETDAAQIAMLLGFSIPKLPPPNNPPTFRLNFR